MLTRKQHELLLFIHERLKEAGIPRSFDEMKEALDLASKSGIHRLITALEERGFLRRLPHRARALAGLKLHESAAPAAADLSSVTSRRRRPGRPRGGATRPPPPAGCRAKRAPPLAASMAFRSL